jgi:hypothetical protein
MSNLDFNKPRFDHNESNIYLCVASQTLKSSRTTGKLLGHAAPAYKKIGGKVIYERAELDRWLDQFETRNNTAA